MNNEQLLADLMILSTMPSAAAGQVVNIDNILRIKRRNKPVNRVVRPSVLLIRKYRY